MLIHGIYTTMILVLSESIHTQLQ